MGCYSPISLTAGGGADASPPKMGFRLLKAQSAAQAGADVIGALRVRRCRIEIKKIIYTSICCAAFPMSGEASYQAPGPGEYRHPRRSGCGGPAAVVTCGQSRNFHCRSPETHAIPKTC